MHGTRSVRHLHFILRVHATCASPLACVLRFICSGQGHGQGPGVQGFFAITWRLCCKSPFPLCNLGATRRPRRRTDEAPPCGGEMGVEWAAKTPRIMLKGRPSKKSACTRNMQYNAQQSGCHATSGHHANTTTLCPLLEPARLGRLVRDLPRNETLKQRVRHYIEYLHTPKTMAK